MNKHMSMSRIVLSIIVCIFAFSSVRMVAHAYTIKDNGKNGIYIDIDKYPYTKGYVCNGQQLRYSPGGCTWYAARRIEDLTGTEVTVWTGQNWWDTYYSSYGFTRYNKGTTPPGKSLLCYPGHVAVLELIDGDTYTISDNSTGFGTEESGYCAIREVSKSKTESDGFLGYVYFGVPFVNDPDPVPSNDYKPLVDGKRYYITNEMSGYSIEVPSGSTEEGHDLSVWPVTKPGDRWQSWIVREKQDGYLFENAYTGKALDVEGATVTNGTPIQQYTIHNGVAQIFRLVDKGKGKCGIININSGKAVEVYGNDTSKGAVVKQYTFHGGDNQLWIFEPADNGVELCGVNEGATYSGVTTFRARRFEGDSNHYLYFYIDDDRVSGMLSADKNGYFSVEVDTKKYSNGNHQLKCYYANSLAGWSDTKTIKIENKHYKLYLDPNGGSFSDGGTQKITVSDDLIQGDKTGSSISNYAPTRDGYEFDAWYDEPEGGTIIYDADGKSVNDGKYWNTVYIGDQNLTVYAHWKNAETTNQSEENTTWQEEYTYELKDGNIYLQLYKGAETEITVPRTATIDKVSYNTVPGKNTWSGQVQLESIVFEEGIVFPADCSRMFYMGDYPDLLNNPSKLKKIDMRGVNTENVKNMGGMFSGCVNLTSLMLGSIDTSSVTSMYEMFNYCWNLESLDVSHFRTENVTSMDGMFYECKKLRTLDVSGFNTSKVESMGAMFGDCFALESLDLSHFDTRKVYSMGNMFQACRSLKSLDLSSFDTSEVHLLGGMFKGCENLQSVDISHFDSHNVEMISEMFVGCYRLQSIDMSSFDLSNMNSNYTSQVFFMSTDTNPMSLWKIETPRNLKADIDLPTVFIDQESGTEYTQLPKNMSQSLTLVSKGNVKPVTSVNLPTSRLDLGVGKKALISATVMPTDTQDKSLSWSSSDESVAIVDGSGTIGTIQGIAVGEAVVTVESSNGKSASCTVNVIEIKNDPQSEIIEEDTPSGEVPEGIWIAGLDDLTYDGTKQTQEFRVYDHETLLVEKTDYTVSYKNNQKAYTIADEEHLSETDKKYAPQAILTMKGNYNGKETAYFSIYPLSIEDSSAFSVYVKKSGAKRIPVLSWNGKTLKENTDFTVTYNGDQVLFTGTGSFTGSRTADLSDDGQNDIKTVSMSKVRISSIPEQIYCGEAYTADSLKSKDGKSLYELVVSYGPERLVEGKDFEIVRILNATKVGTATIVLQGLNAGGQAGANQEYSFVGERRVKFKITGCLISADDVSVLNEDGSSILSAPYQKAGAKPTLRISYKGKTLKEGRDYVLSYTGNTKFLENPVKRPAVKITGKGDFKGTRIIDFKITRRAFSSDSGITVVALDKTENRKANKYQTTVKVFDTEGKLLKAGVDYEKDIVYLSHGTAMDSQSHPLAGETITVRLTGKGGYQAESIETTYRILPTGEVTDIGKATFVINNQDYNNGEAIEITSQNQFTKAFIGKEKKQLVFSSDGINGDFCVIPGSYSQNRIKGSATVTLRGINGYSGVKTVKFKIGVRSILGNWFGWLF